MAKTVTLAGATYQNVPAILLPMPTGGSAKFIEESETGGGSLPSGIKAFDAGTITVSADFTTTRQTFNHNLGVTPDLVMVFADGNVAQTYSMLFALRSTKMGYRSSSYNSYMGYHGNNSSTTVSLTNSSSASYGVSNLTATSFQLASASNSYYWRKGTYKYFAIKWA